MSRNFAGPQAEPAGLDVAEALERLGGDASLLRDLLRQFADQYANRPAELRLAVAAGDNAGALLLAHSLRGVAGNLSARDVSRAAADLERALAGGAAKAQLLDLCDRLEHALGALFAVLPGLELKDPAALR